MSKHTPGPWFAEWQGNDYWEIRAGSAQELMVAEIDDLLAADAANARLIAKAPEMYDLLSQLVQGAGDGPTRFLAIGAAAMAAPILAEIDASPEEGDE